MATLYPVAIKKREKKAQKPNKIFIANHTEKEKKTDFANLASKKPNWQS